MNGARRWSGGGWRRRFGVMAALLLTAAAPVAAAPLGTVRANGIIEVRTPVYELSFFPGCMFPFQLGAGGKILPEPVWLDRIVGMDGTAYFLNIERFAERRILENDAAAFTIEMSGTYCKNDDVSIPGGVQAKYVYRCTPEEVALHVTVGNPEKRPWKAWHVLVPGWKKFPGRNFIRRDADAVAATDGVTVMTLKGPGVSGWEDPRQISHSYLTGCRRGDWQDAVVTSGELKMILRPAAGGKRRQ